MHAALSVARTNQKSNCGSASVPEAVVAREVQEKPSVTNIEPKEKQQKKKSGARQSRGGPHIANSQGGFAFS